MIPDEIIFGAKPLFLNESGNLVLGKGSSLFLRTDGGELQFLVKVPESSVKQVLYHFSPFVRLARLGFGVGVSFREIYYFTFNKKIYSFDAKTKNLQHEYTFDLGRGPLSFTPIQKIPGFRDGLYFGEYLDNPSRTSVRIYRRETSGAWNPVFEFLPGQINHIHSLISDSIRNCVWILTGDFNNSAGIWMAKDGFNEVTQIVAGQQIYRACVAFPVMEGLLYATDTQFQENSIRLLKKDNNTWTSKFLSKINGPCIYGCELNDYFIFSTSTEPAAYKYSSKFLSLFDVKPGLGIIENKSHVISMSKKDFAINILFLKKKDLLPYRLFQFGSVQFPTGRPLDNVLYSYSIGNLENDLSTEVYNLGL
jgi:hypothetical protein